MFSGSDAVGAMRDASRALQSVASSLGDEIRALDRAEKAIAIAKAERLAEMDATGGHESEGASSITVWARREIHQDAPTTRAQVRAAATMRQLPEVGEAARAGTLAMRHVESFTYALAHIEDAKIQSRESEMVAAAVGSTPKDFHDRVRHLRDRLYPDDLDRAYLDGMERRDIQLAKTFGGWHLSGFLDIETGTKLDMVLRNLSVPRTDGDRRSAAQRRMDGLEQLLDRTLEHGLPSDNGIRPHLTVVVEAETLAAIAHPDRHDESAPDESLEPAVLQGFGAIGPVLLSVLLGDAEVTPILIKEIQPNPEVLDVGHAHRFATPRQAKAISFRQAGVCASDGCHHPIGHNHHLHWWSNGGRTSLDEMDGRCSKCHALIHAGKLKVNGHTSDGWPKHLSQRRRRTS